MPEFEFSAFTAEGKHYTGHAHHRSAGDVRAWVRGQGHFVDRLVEKASGRRFRRARISRAHLIHLYQTLSFLLHSGIPLVDILKDLKETYGDPGTRLVLREVHSAITSGSAKLSEALAQFPRTFREETIAVIQAGEEAGSKELASRFEQLRRRLIMDAQLRRTAFEAFSYPAFILLMTIASMLYMVVDTLPKLKELFLALNVPLPGMITTAFDVSDHLRNDWPTYLAVGVAGAGLGYFLWQREVVRAWLDRVLVRMPITGAISRSLFTAQLASVYAALYRCGVPPIQIFDLCGRLTQNRAARAAVGRIKRDILTGADLAVAFRRSNYFDPIVATLVHGGEKGGRLDEALLNVADFFAAEAEHKLKRATSALKPAIIIVAALLVGAITIFFFTAVSSSYSQIR